MYWISRSVCFLFVCLACAGVGMIARDADKHNSEVVSVRVYSMYWDTLTNDALTVEALVEISRSMGFTTIITDSQFCRMLREMLSQKCEDYEDAPTFPMDVRTVFFVERKSGAVDTLSFNNFTCFRYNQDYLQLDTLLLDHVLSALPHGQVLNIQELKPYWTD